MPKTASVAGDPYRSGASEEAMTNNSTTTPPKVHNGTYTLSSPTGNHVTIKLRTVRTGKLAGERIVELLTGPCNETDYLGLGFWNDERCQVNVWRRHSSGAGPIAANRYSPDWNANEKKLAVFVGLATCSGVWEARGYEMLKSGACLRCNRTLTTPESIARGVGPECASKGMPGV